MKRMIFVAFLALTFFLIPAARAEVPSEKTSFIYANADGQILVPYQQVEVTVGLLDVEGRRFQEPPEGKVFFWLSRPGEDKPIPAMKLVAASVPEGVYMHELDDIPGVFIADAASIHNQRSFRVQMTRSGSYELKATVLSPDELPFSPGEMTRYNRQLFDTTSDAARTLTVGATPVEDVSFLLVSPAVNGVEQPSVVARPPRGVDVSGQQIPVHEDGSTPTELTIRLYRNNGAAVGEGVQVFVTTNSQRVRVSKNPALTDASGTAHVTLAGKAAAGDVVAFRLNPHDEPVRVKLTPYTYHPQRVVLSIGKPQMMVDSRYVALDSPAVIKEGRTYVPYRAIGEILGAKIDYNDQIRTITTQYENKTITMTLGFDHYAVNAEVIPMDAKPYMTENYRTMVPLRFIADATGYQVHAYPDARGRTSEVVFTRGNT